MNNSGVLSDIDIKRSIINESIVIEPFNVEQLGNCSYDVTLGEHYYTHENNTCKYINPSDSKSFENYWTDYKVATEIEGQEGRYIVVPPRQYILCHTNEFIGGRNNITTMVKARSTMGRLGITVCKCAGWGDVGYFNRYTLEVENTNDIPVYLKVNSRVAQIVFLTTGKCDQRYDQKGSYQCCNTLTDLINNWTPKQMLPKTK